VYEQKPPARSKVTVLQQRRNLVPRRLVGRHARESGVEATARNTLSHGNKHRDADFIEKLFWSTLAHLQHACPSFAA
jgi:hypothetical protein